MKLVKIHLDTPSWFVELKDTNGRPFLRAKRVPRTWDEHFPRNLRAIYRTGGAATLTRYLMDTQGLDLRDAWQEVKRLFNNPPIRGI